MFSRSRILSAKFSAEIFLAPGLAADIASQIFTIIASGVVGSISSWCAAIACTTGSGIPYFFANSAPISACFPSILCVTAFPISWSNAAVFATRLSAPISSAIIPATCAISIECNNTFCPYEVRNFNSPSKCNISRGIPTTPTSRAASSPALTTSFSISRSAFATASSIDAGLIRPSFINRSRAYLATCRRIGSNDDSTIIPGVSSTKISTPVARCNACIFLPSLPIIRPFKSSSGNFNAVTVLSAVTSDDILSIAVKSNACADSSISCFISFCSFAINPTKSCRMSFSVIFISLSLASDFDSPAIFSNFSCCFARISRTSFLSSSNSRSPLFNFSVFFSS